jgi:hypothetical protein
MTALLPADRLGSEVSTEMDEFYKSSHARADTDGFNDLLRTQRPTTDVPEDKDTDVPEDKDGRMRSFSSALDTVRLNFFSLTFSPPSFESEYRARCYHEMLQKASPFFVALTIGHVVFGSLNLLGELGVDGFNAGKNLQHGR